MAKQSGLGDNYYVGAVDLSGDTNALGRVGGGFTPIDVTDITQSAYERRGGLKSGSIEWVSLFNPATGRAHPTLAALPTTSVNLTYCRGTALGSQAASFVAKQLNYDPTRAADGSLTMAVEAQSSDAYPLEWGVLHTAGKRTDTAATNGTGVDGAAATAFGLTAYLHVFSFTGTSVTVKLQESSDDGSGDAYADVTGGGFAAANGASTQRIQTANDLAVERYLRVVTSGTFTSAVFAVNVIRHYTAVE